MDTCQSKSVVNIVGVFKIDHVSESMWKQQQEQELMSTCYKTRSP